MQRSLTSAGARRLRVALPIIALCACAGVEPRLDDDLAQGALVFARATPGSEALFEGRVLRMAEDGRFIFGLSRDAKRALLKIKAPGGDWRERVFEVRSRDWPVQHIRGVPPRTVSPPAEALPRIAAERRSVRRARLRDSARRDFEGTICWPARGRISGVFGSARSYNGGPLRRAHKGTDVAAVEGTPVTAPMDGVVTLAEADLFFSGGTLIIDHGHGLNSSFLHLSKIEVESGQEVKQGMKIAEVGSTGRATGPHLHWQMNWFETAVDIQKLAPPMEVGCAPIARSAR